MKKALFICLLPTLLLASDMLSPAYYADGQIRVAADIFLDACHLVKMHHPLQNKEGQMPSFDAPRWGLFGIGKGPTQTEQHHPATDLKVDAGETRVKLFAAHDGIVSTVRDAPKYRHYLSITKTISDDDGEELGKLVTLYGHVDLDLDEAGGLNMDGQTVQAGDLISKNLWSDTRGGPHLHFEIRYYRPEDRGTEKFYGFRESAPSVGEWPYGFWNPAIGYGYGDPKNHGLLF